MDRLEENVRSTKPTAFSVSACLLLVGSIVLAAHQTQELSGIQGIPVDGHDIVAGIEIRGTKQIQWERFRERLQANGADLRLGWPLQSQTLCRFKEVLRDVMNEKGFPDAEISLDTRPTFGNPRHLTLKFTIVEGKQSRRKAAAPPLSPAERCMR